jgi:hypothetical protein
MTAHMTAHVVARLGIEFQQKQAQFTSRCFLISRSELYRALPVLYRLPKREGMQGWFPPYAELVEVIISQFMLSQGRYRLDYSPAAEPIWSLHPPTRFDQRYLALLPALLKQMQNPNWPAAQTGEYDLLPSSLDWLAIQSSQSSQSSEPMS